eukprot:TRINITY_DN27543_c0_g1_i1.p1 TRINITY_DN27543_c0_g1~~TRINITY_DN27543_c0_g1_i1.p1  ORF type:complete len:727 (+),score=161.84 TRINITY_DN27543_c0_g1_i1:98-2278(+)
MEGPKDQKGKLAFLRGVAKSLHVMTQMLDGPGEEKNSAAFVTGVASSLKAVVGVLENTLPTLSAAALGAVFPDAVNVTASDLKSALERLQEQVSLAAKEEGILPPEYDDLPTPQPRPSYECRTPISSDKPMLLGEGIEQSKVKTNGEGDHSNGDAANGEEAHAHFTEQAEDASHQGSEGSDIFLRPEEEVSRRDVFMKPLQRRPNDAKYLFNPTWNGKMAWDFFVMFLVIFDSLVLPFQIAFKNGMEPSGFDNFWFWITFLCFSADIFCTFCTAIELDEDGTPDSILRDRWAIAKTYLKGWFILDFVSTVPWGEVAALFTGGKSGGGGAAKLMKIMKFLRIMRLMRMLRMAKLKAIWENIETTMGSVVFVQTMMLLKVLVGFIAMCHWSGCIFWMVGSPVSLITELLPDSISEPFMAMPHWTTVPRKTFHGQTPWTFQEQPYIEQYIFCFYWSLGVMRTMPAEVTPVNIPERMFVLFFMCFALSAFAISVGSLTQAYFKIAERSRGFNDEMFAVRMHLKRVGLEKPVARQVKGYIAHLFERRRIMAKEANLLDKLPDTLKSELAYAQTMKQLQYLPQVQGIEKHIMKEVVAGCQMYDRLPGDVICIAKEAALQAWVLVEGRCQAESYDCLEKLVLRSPYTIDEECLLTDDDIWSEHTVTTITCCEMLSVDKVIFNKYVLHEQPSLKKDRNRRPSVAIGIPAVSGGHVGSGREDDTAAAATAAGAAG